MNEVLNNRLITVSCIYTVYQDLFRVSLNLRHTNIFAYVSFFLFFFWGGGVGEGEGGRGRYIKDLHVYVTHIFSKNSVKCKTYYTVHS